MRSTVDFPAPDGPASARQALRSAVKAMPSAKSPSRLWASTRSKAGEPTRTEDLDREQQGERHADQDRGQRERGGEVDREALVDGQRGRLRDPPERPRENERRAELPPRAAPGQRGAGHPAPAPRPAP